MLDFFNALSDLLGSDLIRGYVGVIVVAQIIIIVLTGWVTWLVFSKVIYRVELNQAAEKESHFSEMEAQIKLLESKNQELSEKLMKYEFEKALDHKGNTVFEDSALDKFKRK